MSTNVIETGGKTIIPILIRTVLRQHIQQIHNPAQQAKVILCAKMNALIIVAVIRTALLPSFRLDSIHRDDYIVRLRVYCGIHQDGKIQQWL